MKRKNDSANASGPQKRRKGASGNAVRVTEGTANPSPGSSNPPQAGNPAIANNDAKPTHKIRKLVPQRPFPTVPTSVSATGPRSAHKEGKNMICISRKTPLAAYMRRCKDVVLKDGYKTLHLSAMGAAIPHLLHLVFALPPILPFSPEEITTTTTTGTTEVQDELIPEDEDEDISYRTRCKSTLLVIIKIGDGEYDGDTTGAVKKHGRAKADAQPKGTSELNSMSSAPQQIVVQEPEQDL
ncbi:hypothetical protein HGRIS_013640 [Hohenbuehelia grisea]|uniref:Uncharacterized protein n=1 Tax=Hohenbuehelia grisea TaxID=104357 RepID=A0ABR3IWC7_9AGAR